MLSFGLCDQIFLGPIVVIKSNYFCMAKNGHLNEIDLNIIKNVNCNHIAVILPQKQISKSCLYHLEQIWISSKQSHQLTLDHRIQRGHQS